MFSITIRLMRRNAKMLIPAGIAILIGTLFISSTFLFGNTLDHSMRRQMTAMFGDANYVVASSDDDPASAMPTVADYHIDRLERIDGVAGVRPNVGAQVQASFRGRHSTLPAIPVAGNTRLMPITLTNGAWPKADGEIALPADAADRLGVGVGDVITIDDSSDYAGAGTAHVLREKVVGLTRDDNGAFASYGGAAAISERDTATMSGMGGSFADLPAGVLYLLVDPPNGSSREQVTAQVRKALPSGISVTGVNDYADKQMKQLSGNGTNIITTFMLSFGALAMFVAALVIANTFQVLVARRRRTLALLRAIGARKGQLYASVLGESALLGLVSSMLGIAAALALMGGLHVSGLRLQGIEFSLIPTPQVFWVPLAFGVAVTMLASLGAARSTTAVSPLEALRPIELTDTRRAGLVRMFASMAMIVLGIAAMAFSVWQNRRLDLHQTTMISGDIILLPLMAGMAMAFVGLLLSAVRWLPALLHAAGSLAGHIGPSAAIASANIRRNPRRIAATGAALLIGVTLVSCIGTGAASAKATAAGALDSRYSVDLQVTGPNLDQRMVRKITGVHGVKAAEPVATAVAQWKQPGSSDKVTVEAIGISERQRARVFNAAEATHPIGRDVIDMMTTMGDKTNPIENGDKVDVSFNAMDAADGAKADGSENPAGTATLTAYKSDFRVSSDYAGVALVDPAAIKAAGVPTVTQIWVKSDGTTTAADLFAAVQNAVSDEPGVQVTGSIAERMQWNQNIDMAMAVLVALLSVAVLIALVGVANTLSLSVIERTRESATLRAIGMTRGQLRRSLAVEALFISLGSGGVGLVVGTIFGWLGSNVALSSIGTVRYPVDWRMYAAILLVAAIAALIASVAPARRAARTAPVEALAEA
ncbi:FtsX-like permease family protein [Bifidobacterium sp. SMB2]|uniref:FtsX-like permease family protein n=1 Tax=Bifidobacterium saimiriisciurei TaxID=2661627 RepID=A0ABX0C6S6_9BIFI|nr:MULTISPECIES: ABC transporter permease [Bifidobacterium]NEG96070.1 FtsX-like permease family protein [Bifidobacterium sp. SMB2]NEH10852.1 FtsX-like permease family protein [Bifidobacterium saimiriisciurei]